MQYIVPEDLSFLQYSCRNLPCVYHYLASHLRRRYFSLLLMKKLKNYTTLIFRVTGTEGALAAVSHVFVWFESWLVFPSVYSDTRIYLGVSHGYFPIVYCHTVI